MARYFQAFRQCCRDPCVHRCPAKCELLPGKVSPSTWNIALNDHSRGPWTSPQMSALGRFASNSKVSTFFHLATFMHWWSLSGEPLSGIISGMCANTDFIVMTRTFDIYPPSFRKYREMQQPLGLQWNWQPASTSFVPSILRVDQLHLKPRVPFNLSLCSTRSDPVHWSDYESPAPCSFQFHGQMKQAVGVPEFFMREYEEEMARPTGLHTIKAPQVSMRGVFVSSDCGLVAYMDSSSGLRQADFPLSKNLELLNASLDLICFGVKA